MNDSSRSHRNSGAIWHMHRQCIPGSFFSAYTKEPGDEAKTARAMQLSLHM